MSNTLGNFSQVQGADVQKGFLKFLRHLEKGDDKKAYKIKNSLIPKTIYKLFSLSDTPI